MRLSSQMTKSAVMRAPVVAMPKAGPSKASLRAPVVAIPKAGPSKLSPVEPEPRPVDPKQEKLFELLLCRFHLAMRT